MGGKWQAADYTIKVDGDAVFSPQRLRNWLSTKPGDSPHGLYYENCPNVQMGFFGHLEIMTRTAAQVLTQKLENCYAEFGPCARTSLSRGAWTTTMWTRLRLSMLPQMVHAKPTGPRARRRISTGIPQIALRSRRSLHTPSRSPQSTRSA